MSGLRCTNCGRPYPETGAPLRCPVCQGLFDFATALPFDPAQLEPNLPGLWRYRHAFCLPAGAAVVTLGEGHTPLAWEEAFGRRVAFKQEHLNPTGSVKDRGAALLVSFLQSRGAAAVMDDTSGNAGISLAAYAAQAGLEPGGSTDGYAYSPFSLPGYATIAFELFEQLGEAPGAVIAPAGHGSLLLGIGRGFDALQRAGLIARVPALVGVQARACAPLWAVASYGMAGMGWVTEGETLASYLRIRYPLHGDGVLQMVLSNRGLFVAVDEDAIQAGRDELAQRGFAVEATSAVVWDALGQVAGHLPEPLVVILTGVGR